MKSDFRLATLCAVVLVALTLTNPASAYESVPVTNGGTIVGTVKIKGQVPVMGTLAVSKDQATCGQHVADETILINGGMIQNVVVSIEGITAGKKADKGTPSLSNKNCRFVPHVQTVQVGARLSIDNADPVLHNTHGHYEGGRTAFNLALPRQDVQIKKRIKKAGVISLKCDAGHTWMSAYLHAFKHPYHAVTGKEGAFSISDIPPGSYTLSIWHEKLVSKKIEVVVEAGKTTTLAIELEPAK